MPEPPIHASVQNALDQLRGALRFRWIALAVAWCVAVVLWAATFMVPDTYEATAKVFVDTRTTLNQATQGISLGEDIDSQIQRVRQALLGGPQLEKVAEETSLLAGALTPEAKQDVIDNLRRKIDITGNFSRDSAGAALFTISYQNHDRAKSLQVVDRLLNTFVEGSLGGKRNSSQQAQQFLQAQIADYEQRLSAAEQRLADFKKRNTGLLPSEQGDYFSKLQSESDALDKAKEDLAIAERKRDELARQLHGAQPFIAGTPSAAAAAAPGLATDTEARIEQTQKQLDELLLRFTDKHPDVIALRATLKELKARQQAEIAAAKRGDPIAAQRVGLAANPVYQSLQMQYDQTQLDIAAQQQDIADREKRIAQLHAAVNTAPEVEAQFAQLNRDYDVTRTQYQALLKRLDEARLGEQAEATGIVKFEVIDPPTAQFEPVKPNRPLLIGGAILAAIAAGGAAAYLLHMLRPVFVSTRQLAAVTGLTVLGAVGLAWHERFELRQRRRGIAYVGGIAALVLTGCAVLLLQSHIAHVVRGLLA